MNTALQSEPITKTQLASGIYQGTISHTRHHPCNHHFSYKMGMLVLDLNELTTIDFGRLFSWKHNACLRFNPQDYMTQAPTNKSAQVTPVPVSVKNAKQNIADEIIKLQQKVLHTVQYLLDQQKKDQTKDNNYQICNRVVFAGQVRHFGFYFSPVNFFFCYQNDTPLYMLAEVSNTPWNERHYYLVDLLQVKDSKKMFHVSPFMNMDMHYKWQVTSPASKLLVKIDSHNKQRLFSAWLNLSRQELTLPILKKMLWNFPFMTLKIFLGIYWQALKIFVKGIPFVSHKKALNPYQFSTKEKPNISTNIVNKKIGSKILNKDYLVKQIKIRFFYKNNK